MQQVPSTLLKRPQLKLLAIDVAVSVTVGYANLFVRFNQIHSFVLISASQQNNLIRKICLEKGILI